jgi:hypothetical protein
MKLPVGFVVFLILFTASLAHTPSNKTTDDPDGKAEYACILTVDKLNKLEEVRKAVGERADRSEETSQVLEKDRLFAEGRLSERVRILNMKYPEFTAIIRKHGLSLKILPRTSIQLILHLWSSTARKF